MMFVTAPDSWVIIDSVVLPVACIMRSKQMDMNCPKLSVQTMRRYSVPISSTSADGFVMPI